MNIISKNRFYSLLALIGLSTILITSTSEAAGLLKPQNSAYSALTIKEHHVNVVIEDMYATTTVEQIFSNPNSTDLEAIYSFPVPEKAVVGEFSYWIDGVPVTGEVVEKQQARQIYESEKQQGREAAIVEKDQYKTFDISVFPVKAQQDVRVKLVYLQNTQTDTGIGRYVYPLEDGGVDEAKLSFWQRDEIVDDLFTFNVKLRTSYPLDGLRLPKHPNALIHQLNDHSWSVNLNKGQSNQIDEDTLHTPSPAINTHAATLDQDIVLYWRHQQDLPASVDMITYKQADSSKGTYKLTLTPGSDLPEMQQGKDWIFVLDISGSMQGKFSALTEGVRQGLEQLSTQDRFRVVLFNNRAHPITKGLLPATKNEINKTIQQIQQIQPSHGTNLYAGLDTAVSQLDSDRTTALILVTDGVANVGHTQKEQFLNLLNNKDVRLFTFIMGNSANRPLLEEMVRVSHGFATSVSNSDDIIGQLMLTKEKMNHAALRDINVEIKGVRNREMVSPRLANTLYHGQQLTLFGHYYEPGDAEITLTGYINGQKKTYSSRIEFPDHASLHPELERLWAFATIEKLKAENEYLGSDNDTQQAILDTAIEYGLVTDYTSMVVVREEVFKALNIDRNNQKRIERESVARQTREKTQISAQQHRADSKQPMFPQKSTNGPVKPQPRATITPSRSGSGSGAVSPWLVFAIAISIAFVQLRRVRL
ncbi:VIT and VWA domain-containing protein [uncultured Neptuniibacter sp.]|uniref:VIT and vWA domain-containing protein n=1 Tax=uncultured Neptuniibacter sp. TaxID=502143 RepID=UPI00260F89AC|nr:VIT and VWA domain-containing protein [uncultured Neptuniibacter sp.]